MWLMSDELVESQVRTYQRNRLVEPEANSLLSPAHAERYLYIANVTSQCPLSESDELLH